MLRPQVSFRESCSQDQRRQSTIIPRLRSELQHSRPKNVVRPKEAHFSPMTLAYKHTEDKAKIDLDEDDDLFQGGNGFARVCLESKF